MFLRQEASFQRSDNHYGAFKDVYLSWRPSRLECCTLFEKHNWELQLQFLLSDVGCS